MEKRAILAAVLMAGLLILYQALFAPSPPPPPRVKTPAESKPDPSQPPVSSAPLPPKVERPPVVPQRTASVEGPLFRAVVGSEGGALREWVLRYCGDKPMVIPGALGPRGLVLERPAAGSES